MKTYIEKTKIVKEIAETRCNGCGEIIITEELNTYHHYVWKCELTLHQLNHGSFPGQSSTDESYDLCRNCYETVTRLLNKLPPNRTHRDEDSITTTH